MLSNRLWSRKFCFVKRNCYLTSRPIFFGFAYRGRKYVSNLLTNNKYTTDDIWISQKEFHRNYLRNPNIMIDRDKSLPIKVLFTGLLFASLGYNFVLYHRLYSFGKNTSSVYQPTDEELLQLKREIERLENFPKKNTNTGE